MKDKELRFEDVIVVEDYEEAEQFRYESNDEPVEVGTAVGYEVTDGRKITLRCFDGIYFQQDE